MADDVDRPNLEPPRLFGRRREPEATTIFEADDEPTTVAPAVPARGARTVSDRRPHRPRPEKAPKPTRRAPRERGAPLLPGRAGSALTGLVAGGVLVGLTFAGFGVCESVQGTESCGTVPGMALLVVILAIAVFVGRLLLALFKVPDPGSTSFLAVGLTGVILLLFLVDYLDDWPAVIFVPVLTAGSFMASWWVTTTYVEPSEH